MLGNGVANAQQKFASETDLKKEAGILFENDEFDKAFPLYSQLTSIYPKDPDYNYRLGVCMIYSFEDKEKPIRYLEYASTKPEVDKEVLYYLAKAYHLNYRFDDAILKYKEYKKVASSAKAAKLQVDRQIEMCKNGKLLLRNLSDLIVTDKKEMSREDFFRAYDVTGLGGKLLVKPEDKQFKSALDKKKKETSVIFSSTSTSQLFFSSYGDDASKGKDIYTIKRKDNGEWTTPQNLGAPVNTEYDEDFPFLHPNGKVLYFCSKGHNSMGGYDIFKSTWNETTFTWGTPVNMDFPINTPDDDILYVTDFNEKQAYFASARSSVSGKIEVYHINVDRKAIDLTFINGTVIKSQGDNALDLKIIVKDLNNNSIIGIYNSSLADGSYSMKLPNGGKYLFTIESPSLPTQSEVVVLPVQHEFKPIAQEISLTPKKDKLVVKTIFEGTGDDSNYTLANNFIREKARMEVNASESSAYANYGQNTYTFATNNSTSAPTSENNAIKSNTTAQAGIPPVKVKLSNVDLLKIAKEDTRDLEVASSDAKEEANIALNYANQKNQMADSKTKEVAQLLVEANKTNDITKKQAVLAQANEKNALAQQLNDETVAAFNLAKKLDVVAESKKKEAALSKQYATDLEAAVNAPNADEEVSKLDEQAKKIEALSKENIASPSITESLKMDEENKTKELNKAQRAVTDTKQEIADNEAIITNLKADEAKAKKEDLKQGLAKQIAELTEDNKGLEKELAQKTAKAEHLEKEVDGIKNQSALVKSVVADAKTGTSEGAAASVDKTKLEQKVNEVVKAATDNANSIVVAGNTDKPTVPAVAPPLSAPPVATNTAITHTIPIETGTTNKPVATAATATTTAASNPVANATTISQVPVANTANKTITAVPTTTVNNSEITTVSPVAVNLDKTKNTETNATTSSHPVTTTTKSATTNTGTVGNVEVNPKTNTIASKATIQTVASINKKYEDDITSTTEIANEKEREQAKSEVLKSWNKAIDGSLAKQKEELKTTNNPEEKNLYAKNIADAEQASKDIKVQTVESLAKVETLKKKETTKAVTKDNTAAGTTATQATSNAAVQLNGSAPANASNANVISTVASGPPPIVTLESINKKYEDERADKNKISNETEREEAKSEVLKLWNKAIDDNIVKQKADLKATTDEEEKNLYAKKIADAERVSKDIKIQTDESVAKVEILKKQTTAVAAENTTNISSSVTNITAPKTSTEEATADRPASANKTTPVIPAAANLNNTTNSVTNATQPTSAIEQSTTAAPATANKTTTSVTPATAINANPETTTTAPSTEKSTSDVPPLVNKSITTAVATSLISTKFHEQLAAATKIKKEEEREQAKLNILKNWNKAIDDNILKLNSDLKGTSDVQEKTIISAKINDAEEVSKDLKNQTTESVAKVETLKKQHDEVALVNTSSPVNSNSIQPISNDKKETGLNNTTTNTTKSVNSASSPPTNNTTSSATNTSLPTAVTLASLNQKYITEIKSADKITNTVEREQAKTEVLKSWNKEIDDNIVKQKEELKNTTDPEEMNLYAKIIADAEKLSKEISDKTKQKVAKLENLKKEQDALALTVNADNNNPKANKESSKNDIPSTAISATATTANPRTLIELAPNEVFEKKSVAAYSEKQPIPVDEKIPEGLVFKVQIGAFKKPIPQDLFEGIRPITGETTKEGYTRYTAGMFVKFGSAQHAKEQINGFGYKDAFVVAFLNGKRISMSEAFVLINNSASNSDNAPLTSTNANKSTNTVQQTTPGNSTLTADHNQSVNGSTLSVPANSQPITNSGQLTATNGESSSNEPTITNNPETSGKAAIANGQIYYTVQIGVFSQALPENKLKDIPSVTTETTPNGYLRYNTGKFANPKLGEKTKSDMVEAGFKDAFVTAYNNGKRITVAEALKLETNGNSIVSSPAYSTTTAVSAAEQKPRTLTEIVKETNSKGAANEPSKNGAIQPATNEPLKALDKEELPDNIEKLTSSIQQLATNKEPVTVDSVSEPIPTHPGASNRVKPTAKKQSTGNTENTSTSNYTEVAPAEELPPLADSAKQNLMNAISKYNEMPVDSGVVFKVQIGAFKEQIPLEIANRFLGIAKKGIKNYKDENGYTVYMVGSFKTMEDAGKTKEELEGTQLKDAFLVAFNGGKKISLEEAIKLINK